MSCVAFLAFTACFLASVLSGGSSTVSHFSHVGGLGFGFLASLVLLKNPVRPKWEVILGLGAVVVFVVLSTAGFSYFYLVQLPSVCCGC
jgi:hypothetical protein